MVKAKQPVIFPMLNNYCLSIVLHCTTSYTMTDLSTLYTERGLPRRSAKEKASGTIEQIQVKKQPIIEGEIRKKRAYTRRTDKDNNTKRGNGRGKRRKQGDQDDEPQPKRRKIAANSKEKDSSVNSKQESHSSSESENSADESDIDSEDSASEGSGETRIHKYETITENVFVNRKPRKLKEEEMPVCNCPRLSSQPSPGAVPCGPQCINRMMCIECVLGHCPSGDYCTNQRFQRKDYPHVTLFDAGKKGLGVKTTSEIKSGQLVIEYVGEVISIDEARKRMGVDSDDSSEDNETPRKRRRAHFYTLTLTGNECIDASRKGNIARFINHSCDPNCITQKWYVNGETRVGIFAIRDIAKDDELTFDYQFERFGSSRQRCYCGSKNCRKFLCAKPVKELISTNKSENKRRCRHIVAQPQPQLSYFMRQFKDHHYDLPDSEDEESEGEGKAEQQEPEEENEKPIDYRDIVEDPLLVNTRVEPNEPPLFLRRNINAVRKARRTMYRALLFTSFQKEKEEAEKRKKQRDEEKKKKRDSNWMFSVSVERLLKKNLVEITE